MEQIIPTGPAGESSKRLGLRPDEVAARVAAGAVNRLPQRSTRSTWTILRTNIFTRFNALYAALAAIVLTTGYWLDAMFGTLVVVNSIIGVVQELRAKRTLDRLQIIAEVRPRIRRAGQTLQLPQTDVVLDDVIELGPGDQIVVDGEIIESESLEVNESLLTGESEPVLKALADPVLAGSFVTSGVGLMRATKVGGAAFAAQLEAQGRKFSLVDSQLRNGINRILGFITWILVPTGALSIYNQLAGNQAWADAIRGMVAALVPMVPEGLILMTTTAFAVGVIRLGRRNCLVNELPAIEGLARVDVVCADKTGTLTENAMRVSDLIGIAGDAEELSDALAALAQADPRPNASMQAIAVAFPVAPTWPVRQALPFSSEWKFSGVDFGDRGVWLIGAPEVLLPAGSDVLAQTSRLAQRGLRVLLLASSERLVEDPSRDRPAASPRGLVVIEQQVRSDAQQTLEYFAAESVALKILSGDNAEAVGAVARALSVPGADRPVDARTLPPATSPDFADAVRGGTVFGRVSPAQKREVLQALRADGHTVAMTGDGVNDVLALKDADIAVAMGSGSPATRAVAQIVLLDDKFASLPHVVAEGRRVIGNIERVSTLFLTKTVYSVLLALFVGLPGLLGGDALPYPFLPRHITITGWFTIGIPAFILSLAPNHERARPGFVGRVLQFAVPAGALIAATSFACYLLVTASASADGLTEVQASSAVLLTLTVSSLWVLGVVARPFTWWKLLLVAGMSLAAISMFLFPFTREVFELDLANESATLTALACAAGGVVSIELLRRVLNGRAAAADQPR